MIIKSFELKKENIKNIKYFLLYGKNSGYIKETVEKNIQPVLTKNIYRYEETEIINDAETFEENLTSQSFFEDQKLIIISRATDKIHKIVSEIIEKNLNDIFIILICDALDKKSKLRNFFEKSKKTICIPFYEDNSKSLNILAQNFLRMKKISLSQLNINLIVERCGGDRINLYNELEKIENYSKNKKQIKTEDILKLSNLTENLNISDLINNTLAKNKKKTLHILNESIFGIEDSIMILRIFLNKLKLLLKIHKQLKIKKNIDEVINSYRPPIFWKEKDIIKKQIEMLSSKKINELIVLVNKIELLSKKYPNDSKNYVTNFLLDQTVDIN